jgi:hypothetical protein
LRVGGLSLEAIQGLEEWLPTTEPGLSASFSPLLLRLRNNPCDDLPIQRQVLMCYFWFAVYPAVFGTLMDTEPKLKTILNYPA